MCFKPFGIVENQLLLECSEVKCGEQYCSSCVQAIQGIPPEHPFTCISCKNKVIPQRNILIETHLIWKSMCKRYANESFLDPTVNLASRSSNDLLITIKFRLIHLQSRLDSFRNRAERSNTTDVVDEMLIVNVKNLYTNLENLAKEIEETDQEMERRGITVSDCLKKYKEGMEDFDRLCDALIKDIEKLEINDNTIATDANKIRTKHIKRLYRMGDLDRLSSEQNITAIDGILEDLSFRKNCLSSRIEIVESLLKNEPDQIKTFASNLNGAKEKREIIHNVLEDLNYLRGNFRAIDRYVDDLDKLLRDSEFQNIPCSRFILLVERLRVRTEELEIENNFPKTTQLMVESQNDHRANEEFKPKAIDLFKTLELDVKHLLTDFNCVYSIPYKVGVIGAGSVGKSALVMNLANINHFSAMVNIERSTFGYLQFDTFIYRHLKNGRIVPITFIDIEGATDTDTSQSIGNYIELITKADCDLYIIVFDKPFSKHNRTCQKHIERELARKCLLVMSKADCLLNEKLQNKTGEKYDKRNTSDYRVKLILHEMKTYASKTVDGTNLADKVYLTAAACQDDSMKDVSFAAFDMNELKKRIASVSY